MDQALLARILGLPAPTLLIGSILVISLWGLLFRPIRNALMLVPYRVARGEVHRLLTAGWVHAGLGHLAVNMLALYFFAEQTVHILGTAHFLFLYLSAVVVAFIPTTLRHRRNPSYASLGASGGIAAVMLAALLLHPRLKIQVLFLAEPVHGATLAVAYLVYSLVRAQTGGDGVNHGAHFTGALYGALLAEVFEPARVERSVRGLF
jgi:membrane associated rhomboid family serine protease